MRLLVDTNIFLDILFERPDLYEKSKNFFIVSKNNRDQIFINASSLKDIFYFAKKGSHDKKQSIRWICRIYRTVSKVIDCSANDAISALYDDGDYEDNILRQSALRTSCDAIITRNVKDFADKDIPCLTPEEYLAKRK